MRGGGSVLSPREPPPPLFLLVNPRPPFSFGSAGSTWAGAQCGKGGDGVTSKLLHFSSTSSSFWPAKKKTNKQWGLCYNRNTSRLCQAPSLPLHLAIPPFLRNERETNQKNEEGTPSSTFWMYQRRVKLHPGLGNLQKGRDEISIP